MQPSRFQWRFAASLLLLRLATAQSTPFVLEEAKLVAADPASEDFIGQSVAISGDLAIVGGSGVDGPAGKNLGAAYIFVRNGIDWSQQAKLAALDDTQGDAFGTSVAISGDTAVVGAPSHSVNGVLYSGAAYVFIRTGTTWIQQAELAASDGRAGDTFGGAVSLSGDAAVVGAGGATSSGGNFDGAVYVFTRVGQAWTEQAKLIPADAIPDEAFGSSVALDGDTLLIGAGEDSHAGTEVGSAYVFRRHGAAWVQKAKLVPSNTAPKQSFGASVSLRNGTALIGAPQSAGSTGAAYLFAEGPTGWTESVKLVAPDGAAGDTFGFSVALADNVALVGAPTHDPPGLRQAGSSYVYEHAGPTWLLREDSVPADIGDNWSFGRSVALDGDTGVVGAMLADVGPFDSAGSAYVLRTGPFGTFVDIGFGLGGTAGVPNLTTAGYLKSYLPISLNLSSAKAFSFAPFVVGVSEIAAPFKGGIMVPNPDFVFPLFTDFFGRSSFGGLWPAGIPSGFTTYFQWWIQDPAGPKGFAASNAVAGTTP